MRVRSAAKSPPICYNIELATDPASSVGRRCGVFDVGGMEVSMSAGPVPIRECHDVDATTFRERVTALYEPAVLRGVAAHWPAVRHARESAEAVARYLDGLDAGSRVDALVMPAQERGRLFYNADMSGFNFTRSSLTIREVNDKLLRYAKFERRPTLAVQSALLADCLPGFAVQNALSIVDANVKPRIWLGGAVTTPAHFDESNNIACVVAGRRRFTLFPPEQIANLYIGPLGHAPTGTPISLVSFAAPDFERFPRFREALAAAQVAEVDPGDALYIPALWWHHVESLARYNMLVNYWWKGAVAADGRADSALGCLLHSILALRHLPEEQRNVWKSFFDYYVFDADARATAHIPPAVHGVLGEMEPALAQNLRAFLANQLKR